MGAMAYSLKEVTIRTDNSEEGMEHIGELWRHIMDGRLPILFDSGHQFRQEYPLYPGTAVMTVMRQAATT